MIYVNITLSVSGEYEYVLKQNKYIKWTEIAREAIKEKADELMKDLLLKKYIKNIAFTKEEEKWMEKKDWHPVDELEINPKFVKTLKSKKFNKLNSKDLMK